MVDFVLLREGLEELIRKGKIIAEKSEEKKEIGKENTIKILVRKEEKVIQGEGSNEEKNESRLNSKDRKEDNTIRKRKTSKEKIERRNK